MKPRQVLWLRKRNMRRRAWTIFTVIQVVGLVSIWAEPHWKTDPALALFAFEIILLQPGGLAAVMLVEKLLWMSRVTIPQMHWIELVLTVAFDAGLWLLVAKGWRVIRARRSAPVSSRESSSFSCRSAPWSSPGSVAILPRSGVPFWWFRASDSPGYCAVSGKVKTALPTASGGGVVGLRS